MLTLTATLLIMQTPCATSTSLPVSTPTQVKVSLNWSRHYYGVLSNNSGSVIFTPDNRYLVSLSDIPSALADSAVFNPDDGNGGGGFVVHWLNNKDLSFTSSMELFMLQLRKFSEQQLEQTTEDALEPEGSPLKFDFGMTQPCQYNDAQILYH